MVKKLFYITIIAIPIGTLVFCYFFAINLSLSQPIGIYLKIKTQDFKKGDLVAVCLQPETARFAKAKNFISVGLTCTDSFSSPVLKTIVGKAGDRVDFINSMVYVNNKLLVNSNILKTFIELPKQPTSIVLKKDEVWIMSDYNKHSFDSRYFGAVKQHNIKYKAKAFKTW